jgi:putative aldouronate transport system permease protein
MGMSGKRKIRLSGSTIVFSVISYAFVTLFAFICVAPFVMLLSGSLSSDRAIRSKGFSFFPQDFNFDSYKMILEYPIILIRAYGVTIFITTVGTAIGLFLTAMTAYVISRKSFKYRNHVSFFFYFTTLFNGGMLSTYIFFIRYLQLRNNFFALILPGLFNVFHLLIMRSFIAGIPPAAIESAKIDGAGEFRIFCQIILPLIPAGLATIGLFKALFYWNDWYHAMLYINNRLMFPLQYMLWDTLNRSTAMGEIAAATGILVEDLPTFTFRMAMAMVTTGPILLAYPFVQRFFIRGIAIGSVKG